LTLWTQTVSVKRDLILLQKTPTNTLPTQEAAPSIITNYPASLKSNPCALHRSPRGAPHEPLPHRLILRLVGTEEAESVRAEEEEGEEEEEEERLR
jgi:hypothetical protein